MSSEKATGLMALGVVGIGTGHALLRREIGKPVAPKGSTLIALRAFGIGSIFCVSAFAAATGVVFWSLKCSSLIEFGDKMRAWAPERRRRIQRFLGLPEYEFTDADDKTALAELNRVLTQALQEGDKQ